MRTVGVVQARCGSSRLPGKSLKSLAGRPMLSHVLERAQAIPGLDQVLLVTSTAERDRALQAIAAPLGISTVFGSEHDVLARIYDAVEPLASQVIVRLTGDCPFLDPEIAALVIARFDPQVSDYISNDTTCSGYPDGTDVEAFTWEALALAAAQAFRHGDREHVTPWIRQHCRCAMVMNADGDYSALKLSVDTAADWERAQRIAERLARLAPGDYSLAATLEAHYFTEERVD